MTAPNKPGADKCNEILLTVTSGLFLLHVFVGGLAQDAF